MPSLGRPQRRSLRRCTSIFKTLRLINHYLMRSGEGRN
jgi:hypothetical protein